MEGSSWAIGQTLRPAFSVDIRPNDRWTISTSGYWSQGKGFHAYDNAQSQFLVSYVRSVRGSVRDGVGEVPVAYPLRFSFGVQQQTFYDFPGSTRNTILPIVHFTLF